MQRFSLRDVAFLGATAGAGYEPPGVGTTLQRWYKGESLAGLGFTDGDPFSGSVWADSSGNSEDATPDATNPPIYRDALLTGSLPCIECQSASPHHDFLSFTNLALDAFTIMMMLYCDNQSYVISRGIDGQYLHRHEAAVNFAPLYLPANLAPTLICTTTATGKNGYGTWQVVTVRRSATGVPSWFQDNNGPYAENSADTNTNTANIDRIGGYRFGGGGTFKIAECLIWDGALTDGEVGDVYNDLFVPRYGSDL